MEELYGLYGQTHVSTAQPPPSERDFQALELPTMFHDRVPPFGSGHYNMLWTAASASAATMSTNSTTGSEAEAEETSNAAIRAKIVSHPLYPKLLHAYIDCHKVGAPPDIANVFDEIFQEKDLFRRLASSYSTCFGDDPQLDEFMESYCEVLMKYKTELSRPFNEATMFLNNIETQLSTLCSTGTSNSYISEEVAGSSEEEYRSSGEVEVQESNGTGYNLELKDNLLRKYSGYISSLKNEFSNKKKKGKLPKEARQLLLEWWNIHYKWPYPTEGEKVALAESTGLDQKQINNWFINQRKRHWKPSENMQFAVMDSLYGPFFMNN